MLELIHADSEQLLAGVHSTAQLAERISGKVRRLDTAQTRVQETLGRINLILDRTSCINGVQTAMDQEDWESAANYISTFTELESKLSGSENVAETGQAEEQQQVGCSVGRSAAGSGAGGCVLGWHAAAACLWEHANACSWQEAAAAGSGR
jgi:hypothetical protein